VHKQHINKAQEKSELLTGQEESVHFEMQEQWKE
jgi:hypothetical protein